MALPCNPTDATYEVLVLPCGETLAVYINYRHVCARVLGQEADTVKNFAGSSNGFHSDLQISPRMLGGAGCMGIAPSTYVHIRNPSGTKCSGDEFLALSDTASNRGLPT